MDAKPLEAIRRLPTARADTTLKQTYVLGLRVINDQVTSIAKSKQSAEPRVLETLNNTDASWSDIYEAEQKLVSYFSDAQVMAEATRRFVEAERLGVPSAPALKAQYDRATATPDERRSILLALLDDIHFRYAKRRLDRDELQHATFRLNWIGIGLLAFIIISTINLMIVGQPWEAVRYHQFWVVYFGMLGAYFSRALDLSTSQGTFDYDMMAINFSWWALGRRLIAGAVGALLLYCLIRGRLVGGELFPNPEFTTLMRLQTLYPEQGHEITWPLLTNDFGKLLIWSTIAGFSERLIPDQFGRLQTNATANQAQVPISSSHP